MNTFISRALVAGAVAAAAVAVPSATDAAERPTHPVCASYRANSEYPLRLCDKGEAVKVIQLGLRVVEPNLVIDGYLGPQTNAAVLEFQRHFGLEVDGLVGPKTWEAITWRYVTGTDTNGNGRIDPAEATFVAPAPDQPPQTCERYRFNNQYPLRMCDKGVAVAVAQVFLKMWTEDLAVDGYFGSLTDAAVRSYQEQFGLEVDGLIGPQTWPELTRTLKCGSDADGNGIIDPDEITTDPRQFGDVGDYHEACIIIH